MAIGTFTRFCWKCKTNKSAPGGRLNKQKMWHCAACVEGAKMKWEMKDLYKDQWHKGPPPSIGWWPTLVRLNKLHGYRWWNGEVWSWPAFKHESSAKAAHWAAKKEDKHDIEWTDRPKDWPERSRT